MTKHPTMVVYWADTRKLLTHMEMFCLCNNSEVVSVTPEEVLLLFLDSGRKVVIRGTGDPFAPKIPSES